MYIYVLYNLPIGRGCLITEWLESSHGSLIGWAKTSFKVKRLPALSPNPGSRLESFHHDFSLSANVFRLRQGPSFTSSLLQIFSTTLISAKVKPASCGCPQAPKQSSAK